MKNNKFIQMATLLSLMFATSSAVATIIFDPTTGTGSVGKGDVQDAFLWNNQQLQSNAPTLTFQVVQTAHYIATCEELGNAVVKGKSSKVVSAKTTKDIRYNVNGGGPVISSNRINPQGMVTGFLLNGYQSASFSNSQPVPKVGDSCQINGQTSGTIIEVISTGKSTELNVISGSGRRLLAVY